jgi:hypothetical protein
VNRTGPHSAKQFVRQPQFSARQRWSDDYARWDRAMEDSCVYLNPRASRGESVDLLPSRIANSIGAEFVREAVEDPNFFVLESHERISYSRRRE